VLQGKACSFNYASSDWQSGIYTLRKVTLSSPKNDPSWSFDATIANLSLAYSFKLFPFHFKTQVIADEPQIAFAHAQTQGERVAKGIVSLRDHPFLKKNFLIYRGKLSFDTNSSTAIYFSVCSAADSMDQKQLYLAMTQEGLQTAPITVSLSLREGNVGCAFQFDQLDLPWACQFARFFTCPVNGRMVHLNKGTLSGNLTVELDAKYHLSHLDYDLCSSDLALAHEGYGAQISVRQIKGTTWTHSHQERAISSPIRIWPHCTGHGVFSGAKIDFNHPNTQAYHSKVELEGAFEIAPCGQLFATLNGTFSDENRSAALHLLGNGWIENDGNWKLGVDVALEQASHETMTTHIALIIENPTHYVFEMDFKDVQAHSVELIDHLIQRKYPQLHFFKLEQGVLNGSLQGKISKGRLASACLKDFCVNRALFRDTEKKYRFAADQIKASTAFDFSKPHFFEKAFWELAIENGTFDGLGDTTQVEQVQAHLFMENSYIHPTHITGLINGIKTDVHVQGMRNDLQIQLGFYLTPKDMAFLFGSTHMRDHAYSDNRLRLDLDMHLCTSHHQADLGGSVEITCGALPKNSIRFGAKWEGGRWTDGKVLGGIRSGWFTSECLSSDIINWPLCSFGKNWGQTSGHVALEGRLSDQQLTLSLHPLHLRYLSPYISLEMDREKQTDMHCHFHYDLKSRKWKGEIPLKNAKLLERSFGIPFETFSSQLAFTEEKVAFRDIFATAQGVTFEGNATLEYQNHTDAKLIIDTDQIQGSAQAIQTILNHFSLFKNMKLPLEGNLESGRQGMHLEAYVGNRKEMISWDVHMTLKNGTYPITPSCYFKDLTTHVEWSWDTQVLNLVESRGRLCLNQGKSYRLNLPIARADFKKGCGQYDIRLEAPTHDICRIVGKAEQLVGKKGTQILLDPKLTRFFGAKINTRAFVINGHNKIEHLHIETDLSARDLYHHLDFFAHAGWLPIRVTDLEEMQSPRFEGALHLELSLDQPRKYINCEVKSDRFVFGKVDWNHLLIQAEKSGGRIDLSHFSTGALSIKASMAKQADSWNISFFDVDWKKCKLRGKQGRWHREEKKVELFLEHCDADFSELLQLLPSLHELDHSYYQGEVSTSGVLKCDLSQGIKKIKWDADLNLMGSSFTKGKLRIESEKPVHLHFSSEKGFQIKDTSFEFFHPQSDQLWAKCQLKCLTYQNADKKWEGRGIQVVLPPEMLYHLAAERALPHLGEERGSLTFFQHSFKWENQMELTFDFTWGNEAEVRGHLKEGYYWIQDKSWYLHTCQYHLINEKINLQINTDFDHHPFAIGVEINFSPHLKTHVTVQSTALQDPPNTPPLTLISGYHAEKGVFIQSIEGSLMGLDCSFHHNSRKSSFDQMALTGHLKIDVPKLVTYLPISIQKVIQQSEMGKGYELSGDCILSKKTFLQSYFDGYLKGKRFELLGSEMETLMSEITLDMNRIELRHLTISDVSGIFSIEKVDLNRGEDQKWKVSIPRIDIQDFRPSLLKKVGLYQKQIKPLTIRNLHLRDVQGMLEDVKSFTGRGELSFTNAFKGDYNILIIPFEILSRLGLDTGLLVPICGKLNYSIEQGRIYLTQLSDSHSKGKRSHFYLSPLEPSYIDLSGNLNIKIKMKQHVLLKITQPFTLAIEGTAQRVRYTLK